jgi:sugar-specific transcriptional regulator TrmB
MKNTVLKKIIVLLSFVLLALPALAQNTILSTDARVSVLTCGTGNESYSLFGHTAIRISDPEHFIDAVYNYGAFDFNTPNFVLKFIKGDLQYFAVAHAYTDFINEYNYERRSVYEQELLLSNQQKQELFDNLNSSLASGESHYTYKFIDKNCTSMVVDMINKTLKNEVITKKADTSSSYRTILFPYFDNHFYEKLGTSIIFGTKVDQMGTHIFLPFELMKSLKTTIYKGEPLTKESKTLLAFNENTPVSWWNNIYSYLILLLCIIVLNNKKINYTYYAIVALLGLFFIFAGFYSYHQELAYNYNILLFNPLLLLLLFFIYKNKQKGIRASAIIILACLVLYAIVLSNKAHFLILLPLLFCNGIMMARTVIQYKNSSSTN